MGYRDHEVFDRSIERSSKDSESGSPKVLNFKQFYENSRLGMENDKKDKLKRSKSNFERDSMMFLGASKLSKGGAMVGSRVNLINYNINEYLP